MLQKAKCIVLHSTRYGDSSLIVKAYSSEFGRLTFMAYGIHGKKKALSPAMFQPLTMLNIEIYYKENRGIHKLKEANIEQYSQTLHIDFNKSSIGLFIAEILLKTINEEEQNHTLFEYIHNSLNLFDLSTENYLNFHLVFLMQLTKHLGFYPHSYEDIYNRSDLRLSPSDYKDIVIAQDYIQEVYSTPISEFQNIQGSNQIRSISLKFILSYISVHIPEVKKLKTLQVFNELLY